MTALIHAIMDFQVYENSLDYSLFSKIYIDLPPEYFSFWLNHMISLIEQSVHNECLHASLGAYASRSDRTSEDSHSAMQSDPNIVRLKKVMNRESGDKTDGHSPQLSRRKGSFWKGTPQEAALNDLQEKLDQSAPNITQITI